LLATDGSANTNRMLDHVAAHGEWLADRHQALVLTAVPGSPPRAVSMLDRETVQRLHRDEADKVFEPMRAFFKPRGIRAGFVSKAAPAGDVIAKQAEGRSFNPLMMGAHGHGSVVSVVMGSVATKVLAHCKVPWRLVRRPPEAVQCPRVASTIPRRPSLGSSRPAPAGVRVNTLGLDLRYGPWRGQLRAWQDL
jgi:nucleotide-binding universal stress UspA family protein